jgi:hypothetical protein
VQTPSVIITTNKIKSQGHAPQLAVAKEWVKELL